MADRLGLLFLRAAMKPVRYAASLLMARQVQSGLAELTAENLLGAVRAGNELVASRCGVRAPDVERLLPMAALVDEAAALERAGRQALLEWKRHAGHVGGLLEGVADLTIDGGPPELAVCLARLGRKLAADREWSKPLLLLSDHAARWTELVEQCRDQIDRGRPLAQSFQRRRRMRIVGACVASAAVGLGALIAGWYLVRVGGARARIDAVIAQGELCSWDAISPGDRSFATEPQRQRLEQGIEQCAAQREQERAEAAERERLRVQQEARKRESEQREERCRALAAALNAGTLGPTDEATAEAYAPLLRRVAWRKLEPADLSLPEPALPCLDTESRRAMGEAFDRAVVASPGAWLAASDLSARARTALTSYRGELLLRHKSLFALHADTIARRALVSGDPKDVARAKRLCVVVLEIDMRHGPNCAAMEKAGG